MQSEIIAIDGPAASGKSTVARRVASALGLLYVDSGALYRAVTWEALNRSVDTSSPESVGKMLPDFPISFLTLDGAVAFRINGRDPGQALRVSPVNDHVSRIAAMPAVRSAVNSWLRDMVRMGGLVVEGRDIGTAVFPNASHKFYLEASAEERARRRHAELSGSGVAVTADEVQKALKNRDRSDSSRAVDPLRVAGDAVVVDSTGMGIDEVARSIVEHIRRKMERRTDK